jgi:hypothetical protein
MKTTYFFFCLMLLSGACKEKASPEKEPAGTEPEMTTERNEDWEILFDGTSMDSWKGYGSDSVPEAWRIEDGAMVFYPPEDRPEGESYNLVSRKEYTNFVLSLEWRISQGGNSGIFWGVLEDAKYGQPYETGPEIQVLDNERHPDASNGDTHQAGALYDMVAPASDVTRPAGEWNQCEITVDYASGRGSVALNGQEIVRFPLGDASWEALVAASKFKDWDGFGKFHTGKIGLQDHGDRVAYRNIRIKSL